MLERRLDSAVFNARFASSRIQSRQLVNHGHFTVNNKNVNIPSYLVKEGDVIKVKEKSRKIYPILKGMASIENSTIPEWIEIDQGNFEIKIAKLPVREDINVPVQEQTIVELYSK